MKKFLRKISFLVLTLALVFSAVSCSFLNANKPSGAIDNLPSSSILSQEVLVPHLSNEERKVLSKIEVVEKAERAVVALVAENSAGSGVIVEIDDGINEQGVFYVLTCHHVIASGGKLTVFAVDNSGLNYNDEEYNLDYSFTGTIGGQISSLSELTLVGGDQVSDIALLKIKASTKVANNIKPVKMIDPSVNSVKKGEDVICIGNPTGELPGTVSSGVISYIGRVERFAETGYMNLLQTDAAIYAGSSGGAMFNTYGELIGITNGGNTEYVGINFAIPAKTSGEEDRGFVNVSKQLLATFISQEGYNYGYVSGRWKLGFTSSQQTEATANGNVVYVKIDSVIEGSNAALAGLKAGDIIKSITYYKGGELLKEQTESLSKLTLSVSALRSLFSLNDYFYVEVERENTETNLTTTLNIRVDLTIGGFIFMDTGVYKEAE